MLPLRNFEEIALLVIFKREPKPVMIILEQNQNSDQRDQRVVYEPLCTFLMVCITHPELRADGWFASSRSHLLLIVPAADLLKQVINKVQSDERHRYSHYITLVMKLVLKNDFFFLYMNVLPAVLEQV